jgi:dihydrolipoamide dehydrogenase
MALTYDVAVLGGGIGGYTAAIRAAQLGKKVAIIEQDMLGGTCLHRGCIPSKTFLRSAEVFATFKESEQFGIQAENISVQFDKIQQRKVGIVNQLHRGVIYLMQKNKIDVIQGKGRVIGPSIFSPKSGAVAVELQDGEMETVVPTHLIIATGSRPRTLPGIEIDGQYAMTSDEALNMTELPKSMIIVGGGVIGAEWASLLSDFGVEVTIIEMAAHLLPTEEQELGAELQRLLKKRGVRVLTQASLNPDSYRVEHGQVHMEVTNKGKTETIQADKLLISIGREANVNGIGLENTDIKVERGVIVVNESMQTTEPHIFAVGDVIGGLQLAHAAGHEGIIAAERIAGLGIEPMQAHLVPRCIYTRPEVASVGFTEKQAVEQGRNIKTAKVSFKAIGKALVYGDNNGFVKVIADQDTNDILGVHMIGPHVTDQISEAVLAQILDATPWEVGQAIHPHPTLSEIMGEAMLAIDGKAIGI